MSRRVYELLPYFRIRRQPVIVVPAADMSTNEVDVRQLLSVLDSIQRTNSHLLQKIEDIGKKIENIEKDNVMTNLTLDEIRESYKLQDYILRMRQN